MVHTWSRQEGGSRFFLCGSEVAKLGELLWPGGPVLEQRAGVFPLGSDALALAAFCRPGPGDRLLDLGTGGGVLPLILCLSRPELRATALDISPAACRLARENLARNGIQAQVLEGDLREHRALLPHGEFDLVVSNPPYFPVSAGKMASHGLENARSDGACTLPELCAAAVWSLRYGGKPGLHFEPDLYLHDAEGTALPILRSTLYHAPEVL